MTFAPSNILMLGLRGSGKTTYLAALWHYLESAELADELEVSELQPDRDYLNTVRNSWLALKPVGRTSLRAQADVRITLRESKSKSKLEIFVPDLSGESFRLQWSTRKAPQSYVGLAAVCTGAFLFIHPEDVTRTHAIKAADEEIAVGNDESRISPSPSWAPEKSGTQVQLVELLQQLYHLRIVDVPMRISVVVSAWDLVKAKISPFAWLDSRLPLLSQFMRANRETVNFEIFGVSAQGGDLTEDRGELLNSGVPSARCFAIRGSRLENVSISEPLRFVLGSCAEN